jgi:hypothetical protein
MYARTPRECEMRWLGDQHPCFNHGAWTQDEITKLKGLVVEYGNEQVDWEAVVDKLGVCLLFQLTQKSDDLHITDPPNAAGLHDTWHNAENSFVDTRF